MANSMSKYLRALKSPKYRAKIRKEAVRRGFRFGRIGDSEKEILQDAIFTVENDLEHQVGEYPPGEEGDVTRRRREWVGQMRAARNQVLDDLGWNENATRKGEVQDETSPPAEC